MSAKRWGNTFRRLTLIVFMLAATYSVYAPASTVVLPAISVHVANPLGDGTMVIRTKGLPYYFGGSVVWPSGDTSWSAGADIYFGVMLPDRTTVLTWAPGNGGIALHEGYVPFARGVSNTLNFHTSGYQGNEISHLVSGNEPLGMYFLFLLLVAPGGNPSDPLQWGAVGMQPFFLMRD